MSVLDTEHFGPFYGSHLPALLACVMATEGPVLELGMGYFSTPILHAICHPDRHLVSFESDAKFAAMFADFTKEYHELKLGWETLRTLYDEPWSVVLVDHEKAGRRASDAARFTQVDFLVVHDAQHPAGDSPETIGDQVLRLAGPVYPWKRICNRLNPHTLVLGKYEIAISA